MNAIIPIFCEQCNQYSRIDGRSGYQAIKKDKNTYICPFCQAEIKIRKEVKYANWTTK